jgi:hypothetical protein
MIFTTNKALKAWGRVLHDEDLAQALIDRVLERGRLLRLDGPSVRTLHVNLDDAMKDESDQQALIRISGNSCPEFPEPTSARYHCRPRASIGFKLGNAYRHLMARYGTTPLVGGRWVPYSWRLRRAGESLDVYLNGRLDNGFLLGTVTGVQRSSREAVYIGRRSSDRGFEFAGLIDDVRIYSRALTNGEIDADMRGMPVATALPSSLVPDRDRRSTQQSEFCGRSEREDSQIPGAAGLLGVLVAVMYSGFWPRAGWLPYLVVGVLAGLLLLPGAAPSLPALGRWLIPFTSLAGSATVVASLSDGGRDRHEW